MRSFKNKLLQLEISKKNSSKFYLKNKNKILELRKTTFETQLFYLNYSKLNLQTNFPE